MLSLTQLQVEGMQTFVQVVAEHRRTTGTRKEQQVYFFDIRRMTHRLHFELEERLCKVCMIRNHCWSEHYFHWQQNRFGKPPYYNCCHRLHQTGMMVVHCSEQRIGSDGLLMVVQIHLECDSDHAIGSLRSGPVSNRICHRQHPREVHRICCHCSCHRSDDLHRCAVHRSLHHVVACSADLRSGFRICCGVVHVCSCPVWPFLQAWD